MALISLILDTTWQSHVDDLATLFTSREGGDSLEAWRKLDFMERFQYVADEKGLPSDDVWTKNALEQSVCLSAKNRERAETFRLDGNQKFVRKWYGQSLDDYTECIRYSPADIVGLGFANRSAALYHLSKYRHCILDIERALNSSLPTKLHYKVYNRRAACYKELGCHAKAKEDFEKALACLREAEMDETKIEKTKEEIESNITNLKSEKIGEPKMDVYPRLRVPEVVGGRSDDVTLASKFVEMKCTRKQGRFLVAGRDLSAGDVIISEPPYAAVLLPDFYNSHCHHCFTRTTAPIPCDHCPIALYCTPECRDNSWRRYHSIECKYLPLMHVIGVAHLALRIVAVSGLQQLQEFRSEVVENSDFSKPYEAGYQSVYQLLHHTDNMSTDDLLHYAITAVLLLKCLRNSNFFQSGNPSPETEAYIGGLLLRHLQQLVCNAHAVSDWHLSSVGSECVRDVVDVRVATGIYPTASLMNHSCDPNILSNFYNDVLVVRCTETIKKGEEIFNCYGPHCKRMDHFDRQQALEAQYFFQCRCTACTDIGTTAERHKALKCAHCGGPLPRPTLGEVSTDVQCLDCGKVTTREELNSMVQVVFQSQQTMAGGIEAVDKGDMEKAKERFRQCLKLQKKVLYKEHEEMAATSDQLARVYTMEENYKKAEPYTEFSVKITGRIHGYDSIEYGTELKKLAQIQFNGCMIEKSRKNGEKAMRILSMNLGEESEEVVELVKMMKCLYGATGQFK